MLFNKGSDKQHVSHWLLEMPKIKSLLLFLNSGKLPSSSQMSPTDKFGSSGSHVSAFLPPLASSNIVLIEAALTKPFKLRDEMITKSEISAFDFGVIPVLSDLYHIFILL